MSQTAKDRILANAKRASAQANPLPEVPAASDPPTQSQQEKTPAPRRTPAPEVKAPGRRDGAARTPRLRDVRKNVDLSPDLNRRLGDWQRDTAIELGLARVTAQDLLTELVLELLDDQDLGDRIKDRLHKSVNQ